MRVLFSLLFATLLLLLPTSVLAQNNELTPEEQKTDYLKNQLKLAKESKEKGDLLWAARLVNYIATESADSNLTAEALFELMSIGYDVATQFNKRKKALTYFYYIDKLNEDVASDSLLDWKGHFESIWKEEFKLFERQGIGLGYLKWSNDIYFHSEIIRSQIADQFPGTQWGEKASVGLIMYDEFGVNPEQAFRFLEQYPESDYRSWVYTVIARDYSDQYKYGSDCNPDSDKESRDSAIKYYLKAKETHLPDDGDQSLQAILEEMQILVDGKCPEHLYYLVD